MDINGIINYLKSNTMYINGIINMSEKNKVVIFDVNKNISSNASLLKVNLNLDKSYSNADAQLILEKLYENDFRINSYKVITKEKNEYSINDAISISQSENIPAIITLSMETYDFGNLNSFSTYLTISDDKNEYNYKLYFQNDAINQYKTYDNVASTIAGNMESFMILRTNPKLTGNIKLVVSDDHLYLDTFKVSTTSILNDKKYRHKSISADGDYPYDVYKVFKDVPQGEMYSVYEDSYDPHKHYFDMNNQIENIYEYGAEYNTDNLYSENMKILAPLYIGKHLPTYFAIFKTDRLATTDETVTNSDVFRSMIVQSQCIKIYDLRQHTALGKYLNGYQNMITKYFAGTCSLQFIEQEYDSTDDNYRQGRNTWSGIAIDKGILTDKIETTYFATQILENSAKQQEDFNMFLLNGYSRNMLLYPNILNLEFMFDDELADDMTIHNYYGLYLTENEFIHFNQVIKTSNSDNYELTYYDKDNKKININETSISVIDDPEYVDRIFFASTLNDATYLAIHDDFDLFVKNNVANKAYKNIAQLPGEKVKFDDSQKSFITLDFTKQIKYGEHFKFTAVDAQYKKDKYNVTIELIASNDLRLVNTEKHINPYVLTNTSEYASNDKDDKNRIYRITFYTQDLNDYTKAASLQEQLERIRFAIQKVNSFLAVAHYDEETIGLISTFDNVYFQHILADEVFEDINSVEDPVRCFNYNNITYATLNEDIPDLYRSEDAPFANNGFEILGKRYSNITKFLKISKTSNVFYEIAQDLYDILHNVKCPLIATTEGYQPMIAFNVDNGELVFNGQIEGSKLSFEDITRFCVTSPWNVKCCLISSPYEISSANGLINISSPMACSISLMGINNIKDIDMYVGINEYNQYVTDISATFKEGENISIDNSDPRIRKYVPYTIVSGHIKGITTNSINTFVITEDAIFYSTGKSVEMLQLDSPYISFDADTEITLADTNNIDQYNYKTYKPLLYEKNYYVSPTETETSDLEIPLVPLVNCQWKSNGIYFDNNSLLNVENIFDNELVGNFVQNVYTPAGLYNNQYIINSFKDYINYNGNIETIQEFLMNSKYANAFKKFLTSTFKIETAIGYYKAYIQTLEFIYYGIKFSFKLSNVKYTNEIKLNEYNNYEVYIINDYNASDTNEIYISTIEEFILIVNHIYKSGRKYSNNCIQIFDNLEIANAQYDWYSAPYNYLLQSSGIINNTLYFNKSAFYQLFDSDNIAYMVEYDLPIYESKECNISGENNIYAYFNTANNFESFTKTDVLYQAENQYNFAFNYSYNENYRQVDISDKAITNMVNTYMNVLQDYRAHNTYFVKNNDNIDDVEDSYQDMQDEFINSFDANIKLYIINNDSIKTININDNYKPLTLSISTPVRIKYNQGYFDPNFVDIFSFVINDEISDDINLDTLYANTQVSYISSLRNYYYNKILDSNASCTYNYFSIDQRSPLSTNWDATIYRLYTDDETYSTIPGYQLGIDDKMLFGSKVLAVHNNGIELTKWDYTKASETNYQVSLTSSVHNADATSQQKLQVQLKLTKIFYNYLLANNKFIENWTFIEDPLNKNVYITNYINNTLSKIYNFKNNFDITLYELYAPELDDSNTSISPDKRFVTDKPDNFDEYTKVNNYGTLFNEVNNEVILTITISDYNKHKYYPIVKINKI